MKLWAKIGSIIFIVLELWMLSYSIDIYSIIVTLIHTFSFGVPLIYYAWKKNL